MNTRIHLAIHGRVQGVCFRLCAQDEARRLGLTGWVENRTDGSVEAVAEGADEALQEWVAWCRQGPAHARVTDVSVREGPATGEFDSFAIRHGYS